MMRSKWDVGVVRGYRYIAQRIQVSFIGESIPVPFGSEQNIQAMTLSQKYQNLPELTP